MSDEPNTWRRLIRLCNGDLILCKSYDTDEVEVRQDCRNIKITQYTCQGVDMALLSGVLVKGCQGCVVNAHDVLGVSSELLAVGSQTVTDRWEAYRRGLVDVAVVYDASKD